MRRVSVRLVIVENWIFDLCIVSFLSEPIAWFRITAAQKKFGDGTICTTFCPKHPRNKISRPFTHCGHVRLMLRCRWILNLIDYLIFFLKKLLWGTMKVKFRHLFLRWSWPNVLAYQNFWSTMWHPLVAKFSNMCHFHRFLRVRWKRSPQSTSLPWKI